MDTEQRHSLEDDNEEMQAEYDFAGGQRGRYAHLFPQQAHVVVLSPDLAAAFPNSDAVNEALRSLVKIARRSLLELAQDPEAPTVIPPGASPSA